MHLTSKQIWEKIESDPAMCIVWGWKVLQSISSLPFLSDIDIYINGGFEPEEVEIEIDAIDEIFVPTNQGKVFER